MFNGKTSTVAVPCKYRLADIQCGDYRLVVTPGSKLDSNNTFSPDTVLVNIKTTHKENLFVRTTVSRLQRVSHRASFSPLLRYHILTAVSDPHSTAVIASVCLIRVLTVYGQSSHNSHGMLTSSSSNTYDGRLDSQRVITRQRTSSVTEGAGGNCRLHHCTAQFPARLNVSTVSLTTLINKTRVHVNNLIICLINKIAVDVDSH